MLVAQSGAHNPHYIEVNLSLSTKNKTLTSLCFTVAVNDYYLHEFILNLSVEFKRRTSEMAIIHLHSNISVMSRYEYFSFRTF